jgi:ribosome-associated protein
MIPVTPAITLDDSEIELSFIRASGPGGQNVLTANRFRTQERNRADAIERLTALIVEAATPPPPKRRPTRPTKASKERRLSAKSRRGTIKSGRGRPARDE